MNCCREASYPFHTKWNGKNRMPNSETHKEGPTISEGRLGPVLPSCEDMPTCRDMSSCQQDDKRRGITKCKKLAVRKASRPPRSCDTTPCRKETAAAPRQRRRDREDAISRHLGSLAESNYGYSHIMRKEETRYEYLKFTGQDLARLWLGAAYT